MLLTPPSQPTSQFAPVLACIVAAILWGVLWYPLRLLEGMGLHGLWSALLMYCCAVVFIVYPGWRVRQYLFKHKFEFVLIGLFAGWTNLAFILAMLEGEVIRVLLLFYLSPVWAIIMAVVFLHEKINRNSYLALILAMPGAGLMLWQEDFLNSSRISLADVYALSSGLAFAMTNIVVRKISDVPISLKMGTAWLGVIVLSLLGIALTQVSMPTLSFTSGSLVLLLGFPFMFVMTWAAQYGVSHLPVQRSSIIFLLEIVAGAVSAAILTNEIVSNNEYIGGFLIIVAGLIAVRKKTIFA